MTDEKGRAFTGAAFSESVKSIQKTLGSRDMMSRMESLGDQRNAIDENLAMFIAARTSIYLATASKDGQPYVQHRGGPEGFIRIPDDRTLLIDDYPGNQQYITLGNLSENPNAHLFMIDYETKTRVKIWTKAEILNLESSGRAIRFHIKGWDINCNQHLPEYYSMKTVRAVTAKQVDRIQELEQEVAELRAALALKA